MSDIVRRLRIDPVGNPETDETQLEAAKEIERLRAALREVEVLVRGANFAKLRYTKALAELDRLGDE